MSQTELPPLPEPWCDTPHGWAFTNDQMRDYARTALAAERARADAAERDARRWRYLTQDQRLLWVADGSEGVKWVFWMNMPPPDISAEKLTPTSVMEELAAAIDSATEGVQHGEAK